MATHSLDFWNFVTVVVCPKPVIWPRQTERLMEFSGLDSSRCLLSPNYRPKALHLQHSHTAWGEMTMAGEYWFLGVLWSLAWSTLLLCNHSMFLYHILFLHQTLELFLRTQAVLAFFGPWKSWVFVFLFLYYLPALLSRKANYYFTEIKEIRMRCLVDYVQAFPIHFSRWGFHVLQELRLWFEIIVA